MMAVICYTAIFGAIGDKLREPRRMPEGVQPIAFVDTQKEFTRNGWLCKPPVWEHKTNPRLRARRHKMLAHHLFPDAEYTLWVDGCLTPWNDPNLLVKHYLKGFDICLFRHMERNCVYQELEACIKLRKDNPVVMREQVRRYRDQKYPHNNGLAETTAVLRRHTPEMNKFCEIWWDELRAGSIRDQLSFDYLCWKHGIKYNVFAGNRCRSPHFEWRPHR